MNPIYAVQLVTYESPSHFEAELNKALERWEEQNVDVEVQYSTSFDAIDRRVTHSALIVVRRGVHE